MNFIDFDKLTEEILKDPRVRKIRKEKKINYAIADMVFEARMRRKMTQEDLARKIGTKQPSIARIEGGKKLPTLSSLQKIAKALKTELVPPRFSLLENFDFYPIQSETKATFENLSPAFHQMKGYPIISSLAFNKILTCN